MDQRQTRIGQQIRIGQGFDVHAFAAGRKLILGGVEVPFERGLAGHSDADVLLHAIIDAVLGALAWGDIGRWFPDTDLKHKDAASSKLFGLVWEKATAEGWALGNVDAVVVAQQPKLAAHIDAIRERIAELFSVPSGLVGVKATTTEKLGFTGREEGIAATAVVLLQRESGSY